MKAMILRHGLDPSYYFFTEITAKANGMQVIVDRRCRERRIGIQQLEIERRTDERRAEPAATWAQEGFMVIDG